MGRDFVVYLQDRWNVLDVLSLVILAGGFSVRLIDSGSLWGRGLYALGAPLVFLRVLFYAQYLPFLGSMVEVSLHLSRKNRRNLLSTVFVVNIDIRVSTSPPRSTPVLRRVLRNPPYPPPPEIAAFSPRHTAVYTPRTLMYPLFSLFLILMLLWEGIIHGG